ncbi:MAG: PCMD domain-containing protein, partial [Alistipes sp.]
MKNLYKSILSLAVAVTTFAGCTNDTAESVNPDQKQGVPVSFSATVAGQDTRATIEVGKDKFTGKWETNDAMGVQATAPDNSPEAAKFTYNGAAFDGTLAPKSSGTWKYNAFYPHATLENTTVKLPFGAMRTQKGNAYNSAYDALVADEVTCLNAEAGKNPDGTPVAFKLHRLTSILHFALSSSDAAVAGQKIKSVTITADKSLAATTLDFNYVFAGAFDLTKANAKFPDMGQALAITMNYEAGSEPSVSDFHAFFNVLPGNYAFTIEVHALNGQVATFTAPAKDFAAGTMYTKTQAVTGWAAPAVPTATWVGHDFTQRYTITPTLKVPIVINAQAGIKSFMIDITSPSLATLLPMVGLAEHMDLIHPATSEMANMLGFLGFPTGPSVLNSTTQSFDISSFMSLIPRDQSCNHDFKLTIVDNQGRTLVSTIQLKTVAPVSITAGTPDLWANTTTFTVANVESGTVAVQYKRSTDTEWQNATVGAKNADGTYTATASPTWTAGKNAANLDIHTVNPATGIFAGKTYNYKLLVDGKEVAGAAGTFITGDGDVIPNGDMEGALSCFTTDNKASQTWASGNNTYMSAATGGKAAKLCLQDKSKAGREGTACAVLSAQSVWSVFAAGNLFTGKFIMSGSIGYAHFGQKYTYSARPTALKVKYAARIGNIDKVDNGAGTKGEVDKARIMVCIVDWNAQHAVQSGTTIDAKTFWDPEKATSLTEGKIIGYGSYYITASTADAMQELTIPIQYYQKTAAAPQ